MGWFPLCDRELLIGGALKTLHLNHNSFLGWLFDVSSFFKKKDFYLFIHKRHTERERQRYRQRKKQAPCKEPDVGLKPENPGSRPEQKAGAQLLSHSGIPIDVPSYISLHLCVEKLYFFCNLVSFQITELSVTLDC